MKYLLNILICLALSCGVNAQWTSGGHSGGGYASGGEQPAQATAVDLKVMLQGPFYVDEMYTNLSAFDMIPATQVFGSTATAPWYYTGTEVMDTTADLSSTVNWVLLELRTAPGGSATATSSTVRGREPALLQDDGTITAPDVLSEVRFEYEDDDSVFIIVWSLNHLPIMNSVPMIPVSGVYSYDFTDAQSKAWQKPGITDNPAMKDLGGGYFGMFAGDCNPDTLVYYYNTNSDKVAIVNKVGGNTLSNIPMGYLIEDLNMDGFVKFTGKDSDRTVLYNAMDGHVSDSLRAHIPD